MVSLVQYTRGKIYKKSGGKNVEYIRFKDAASFQHRILGKHWTNHPYCAGEIGFEMNWGKGDVFRCEWNISTNSFTEIGRDVHTWELSTDHNYNDLGSTDGSEDDFK